MRYICTGMSTGCLGMMQGSFGMTRGAFGSTQGSRRGSQGSLGIIRGFLCWAAMFRENVHMRRIGGRAGDAK